MSFPLYCYKAKTIRVLDGDSVELDIDFGATVRMVVVCRLYGVNAPEVTGWSKVAGLAAKEWLEVQLRGPLVGWCQLWVRSNLREKYGRLLTTLWTQEPASGEDWETSLNAKLVAAGHAVAAKY